MNRIVDEPDTNDRENIGDLTQDKLVNNGGSTQMTNDGETKEKIGKLALSQNMETHTGIDGEEDEDYTYKGATLDEIQQAHEQYSLRNKQFKSSKQFMKEVMFTVPLDSLYTVLASCQYNEESYFCPVLVRIEDPEILRKNNNLRYLLQVWDRQGTMVFERSLRNPICNWNISGDHFLFQEEANSTAIYVVHLFRDKSPFLFKFKFPASAFENRINSYYDVDLQRIVIPSENGLDGLPRVDSVDGHSAEIVMSHMDDEELHQINEKKAEDVKILQKLGEINSEFQTDYHRFKTSKSVHSEDAAVNDDVLKSVDYQKSIYEIFGDELVNRAPDKMVDLLQGFLMVAYRDSIIYVNVNQYGVVDESLLQNKSSNSHEVNIEEKDLQYLDLHKNYKIIAI